jgi:hypothetical protein
MSLIESRSRQLPWRVHLGPGRWSQGFLFFYYSNVYHYIYYHCFLMMMMMTSFEPGTVSTSEIDLLTPWISVPSRSEGDQRGRRPAMLHAAQQQPGFRHQLVTCWFPLGSWNRSSMKKSIQSLIPPPRPQKYFASSNPRPGKLFWQT